jgi:hypothetical protein
MVVHGMQVRNNDLDIIIKRWTHKFSAVCRKDARNDTKKLQKAFLVGSNSMCHQHICQHYKYYSERCKEEGLLET